MVRKIDQIIRKVEELERELQNKRSFVRLAKLARSIVYKRTKSGKGTNGSTLNKLDGLSTNYKRWRKRVARRKKIGDRSVQLGAGFKPSKSNLTFTGQLLDSMIIEVDRFSFGVTIPNSKRKRLGKQKRIPTNAEVAGFVESQGREFFALSKGELRIIIKEYERLVRYTIRQKGL